MILGFLAGVVTGLLGTIAFFSSRKSKSVATHVGAATEARCTQEGNEEPIVHRIISSMQQAVVVLDDQERVRFMNQAALQILAPPLDCFMGRSIQEVIPQIEVQKFAQAVLSTGETREDQLTLFLGPDERFVAAFGTLLGEHREADDSSVQLCLIVLSDVSQLRHLETMRKDFVANVSHELRTPITSIKGFAETLLDGAIDRPEDARRFLSIMARQAERLMTIFEDLLSLARIEDINDKGGVSLSDGDILEVLRSAAEVCELQAKERGVTIDVLPREPLLVAMNRSLLEQAIVNLLDNAIKFSTPGSKVAMNAFFRPDALVIEVVDSGCGIEKEHLARVFERFYRVDRARSTKLGGTGLGLAIVKHIAQAHGGYPTVESTVGKGSRFRIILPTATEIDTRAEHTIAAEGAHAAEQRDSSPSTPKVYSVG